MVTLRNVLAQMYLDHYERKKSSIWLTELEVAVERFTREDNSKIIINVIYHEAAPHPIFLLGFDELV
jgi:hypothetical protein